MKKFFNNENYSKLKNDLIKTIEKTLNQKIENYSTKSYSISYGDRYINFLILITKNDDVVYVLNSKDIRFNVEKSIKMKEEFDFKDIEGNQEHYTINVDNENYVIVYSPISWIYDEALNHGYYESDDFSEYPDIFEDGYEECCSDILNGMHIKLSSLKNFLDMYEKID